MALGFWHPAHLVATWGGAGLMQPAPGTWGSLAALPFAWGLLWAGGWPSLLLGAGLATLAGFWAARIYVDRVGGEDPAAVVIDEVAGQWLTLLPATLDARLFVIGFVLFRLFDITKPWPASWADRRLPGAAGIMLDDLIAGLYGAIALALIAPYLEL